MQQRYYDPIAGRFLSVDPVVTNSNSGKSFGRYHYAENNPFKFVDPNGGQSVPVITAIPNNELTAIDRAAISAGNRAQLLYENAVKKSGNEKWLSSYMKTPVEYKREPSAAATKLLAGESFANIRAYREPRAASITLLPSFGELPDRDMTFSNYHGMRLGVGGDGVLFLVMAHEHGHILDMENEEPHDREAAANNHAEEMAEHSSGSLRRGLREVLDIRKEKAKHVERFNN